MAGENITNLKGQPFSDFCSISLPDFEPNLIQSLANHSSENIGTNLPSFQELQPYKPGLDSNKEWYSFLVWSPPKFNRIASDSSKVLEQALIQSGFTEESDFSVSNWQNEDINYPSEIETENQITNAFGDNLSNLRSDDLAPDEKIQSMQILNTTKATLLVGPKYYSDDRNFNSDLYLTPPQTIQDEEVCARASSFKPNLPSQHIEMVPDSKIEVFQEVSSELTKSTSLEVFPEKVTEIVPDGNYPRPALSFKYLIVLAIKSCESKRRCTVKEIYSFIMDYFPYYRTAKLNWQNGIRHNLSILKNKCFVIAEDKYQKSKNSHYWMINPMEAQETNEKLVKAWKKNVDQIKTSTIMPDALEDLVNEENEATQFIGQELSTMRVENQLYSDLYTVDLNSSIMDYYSSVMDHDNSIMDLETSTLVPKSNPVTELTVNSTCSSLTGETACLHKGRACLCWCVKRVKSENEITKSASKKRNKKVSENDATPKAKKPKSDGNGCLYERPNLNFNNLVTLALKNSTTGSLMVHELYNFVAENFPYYGTNGPAANHWKNSLRHTLIRKEFFISKENPGLKKDGEFEGNAPHYKRGGKASKFWSLHPEMHQKLVESAKNACLKNEEQVKKAMTNPELFEALIY